MCAFAKRNNWTTDVVWCHNVVVIWPLLALVAMNLIWHGAEWHYVATSHGKGLCNGVGGTVKHLATHASLQRSYDNQLYDTTSVEFFDIGTIQESALLSNINGASASE